MSSQFYTGRHYNQVAGKIANLRGALDEQTRVSLHLFMDQIFAADSKEYNGRYNKQRFMMACQL